MLSDYVAEHGYIIQAACTTNSCHKNKEMNEQKIHKNYIKLNITVPVKPKHLMNFINGIQDQKNLEVMLILMLFSDL